MTTGPDDPHARHSAEQLAAALAGRGDITDVQWQQIFAGTPRHVFLPCCAIEETKDHSTWYRLLTDSDDPVEHAAWLHAVYTDQTLITQIDGQPVETALADGPGQGWATSSSTAPGLMAWMLHTLDLKGAEAVLEIGTGTGYNAALLAKRLGEQRVTSVDIDPGLSRAAEQRLDRLGIGARLVTGDGRHGDPAGGPYDRIVATTSWPYLPPVWPAQVASGGMILTNISGLLGGAMLLATVSGDSTAEGRFLPRWAGFMVARGSTPRMSEIMALDTEDGTYDVRTTNLEPTLLDDPAFAFCAQLHTIDARPYWATHEDGRPLTGLLAPDGSWAEVYPPEQGGGRRVEQGGPRRLWTAIEDAHRFWTTHGEPDWSSYGVTATIDHQYAWYGAPDGPNWPLPTPRTGTA